jgi:hypothetical protein
MVADTVTTSTSRKCFAQTIQQLRFDVFSKCPFEF